LRRRRRFLLDPEELAQLTGQPALVGHAQDNASSGAGTVRWRIPADATAVQGRVEPTGFETDSAVLATPGSFDAARRPTP